MKPLLEPIIDLTFSVHNFGFRPGDCQRHAVEAAPFSLFLPFFQQLSLNMFGEQ
jgi:retron-type reverse transcriptase